MKMKFNMLNSKKILVGFLSLFFVTLFVSCNEDTTPSLWDTINPPKGTKPVITSIDPPLESLAGVDVITINGSGFNPVAESNWVFFGSMRGTVLQATATQLVVRAPNNPKDTLQIKCCWTKDNDYFSDPVQYKLRVAAGEVAVKKNRTPYGIAVDKSGSLYFLGTEVGSGGIVKVASDGTESTFAPKGAESYFTGLKVGPNGSLFAARKVKAIFEIKEGVAAKAWATTSLGNITDFDFDNKGFIWAGGAVANAKLYRVAYDNPKRVESYDFTGEVKSVRYFQGALYVAAKRDNAEKIFKIPVVSDSVLDVANAVEYFDFTASYPTAEITSITFSQDGVLYAGNADTLTTTAPPIIMVNSDKTSSIFFDVLLGDAIYASPVNMLCWGISDELYFARGKTAAHGQESVRVITKKQGAPYYGRGD